MESRKIEGRTFCDNTYVDDILKKLTQKDQKRGLGLIKSGNNAEKCIGDYREATPANSIQSGPAGYYNDSRVFGIQCLALCRFCTPLILGLCGLWVVGTVRLDGFQVFEGRF